MKALALGTIALFGTVLLAAGCAPAGDPLSDPTPSAELGDPPLFAQHVPPLEQRKVRNDGCTTECLLGWQPAFEDCMAGNLIVGGTPSECRFSAHAAVAECYTTTCAVDEPLTARACPATCGLEAQVALDECNAQGLASRDCHFESVDVFQTCWEADCMGDAYPVAVADTLSPNPPEAEEEVIVTAAATCQDGCEAHELKGYLACVNLPGADVDFCRDRGQDLFAQCMESHCVHPQ